LLWALWEAIPTEPRRRLIPYLGAYVASCLPLLWLADRRGAQQISWIPPLSVVEIRNMVGYLLEDGSNGGPRLFLAVLTILACLTGTGHVMRGWSQRDMPAEWGRIGVIVWAAVLPLLLGLLISINTTCLLDESFIGVLSAPSLLAAEGVMSLRFRGSGLMSMAISAVLVALLVFSLVPEYGRSVQEWQSSTALILAKSGPRDGIVFVAPDGWNAFDYYVLAWREVGPAPTPVFPGTKWKLVANYARDPQVPSAECLGVTRNATR